MSLSSVEVMDHGQEQLPVSRGRESLAFVGSGENGGRALPAPPLGECTCLGSRALCGSWFSHLSHVDNHGGHFIGSV